MNVSLALTLPEEPLVARIVSFIVLVAILLVVGGLTFRVLADFLIPLFFALLLVIVFGPLHRWCTDRCGSQPRLAAALTTAIILLIVLAPILLILFHAVSEALVLYRDLDLQRLDLPAVAEWIVQGGNELGLALVATDVERALATTLQEWLAPLALRTTQFAGHFLLGLFIMTVAVYYFLADGPDMIQTLTKLSPLDEKYQQELIEQFTSLARTMVLANLAAAISQGMLAGIGFYLAGLESVYLLTVLATLMAMVPFLGTAIIWAPVCCWLYFLKGQTTAAIFLACYGVLVVSTADNFVKPMILHGRTNLHPLLALLSVLGGVQALGPIGIFLGPMVVVLLQTLLNIFHAEMRNWGGFPRPQKDAPERAT
jgi:predicted PurR-regulated permease PerM